MTGPSANYCAIPPTPSGEAASPETLTKWTYFLLGCATMVPWNVLANGSPFFLSRMADSPYYSTFGSDWSTAYTLTKLSCVFYCTITSKKSSPSRRIFGSVIMIILVIASLCLSTFMRGTPSSFFAFALFASISLGAIGSYLYASVYAQAALSSPLAMQSMLSGQAAISVAISAVQVVSAIISLWSLSPTLGSTDSMMMTRGLDDRDSQAEDMTARIFFGVSALFLGVTLIAYALLTTSKGYMEGTAPLAGVVNDDRGRVRMKGVVQAYRVLNQNKTILFAIAYVCVVTIAVFPTVTVRVRSLNPTVPPVLFTAVHYLVFNLGDLIGRFGHTRVFPRFVVWSVNKMLALSLMRTLFIPLILACNVYRPVPTPSPLFPPIIRSDAAFMLILFAFGYTTGFVSCVTMLAVSSLDRRHLRLQKGYDVDVDVAAALGGTFQIVGLAVGALVSFGVGMMV